MSTRPLMEKSGPPSPCT